ncbi:hypothetical protein [Hymenobacter ruber]
MEEPANYAASVDGQTHAFTRIATPLPPLAGTGGGAVTAAKHLLHTRLNEPFYAASGENSGQGGYDADDVEGLVAELLAESATLRHRLGEAEAALARAEKAESLIATEDEQEVDKLGLLLENQKLCEELRGLRARLVELQAKFCPNCDRANWEEMVPNYGCNICKIDLSGAPAPEQSPIEEQYWANGDHCNRCKTLDWQARYEVGCNLCAGKDAPAAAPIQGEEAGKEVPS